MNSSFARHCRSGKILACFATILITTLLLAGFAPRAYAAELTDGWEQCGTCEWQIADGVLTFRPLGDGASGTLESMDECDIPWQYKEITSVKVEPGVKAQESLYGAFSNLDKAISMDLSGLDTSQTIDMGNMFADCESLVSLNLSNFDTSNVACMSNMFFGCCSLSSLDLSNFDTRNVTNMWDMFDGCKSLVSLDLSNFNTWNVTDMSCMFAGCESLVSLDLSNIRTSNVSNMCSMFDSCRSLTDLDLTGFNTENVADMSYMFSGCTSLKSLDLSRFNTSNVAYMGGMFMLCSALTYLDLSNFDTAQVQRMGSMFSDCESLKTLDVSNFDTSQVTDDINGEEDSDDDMGMTGMFSGCSSLRSLDLSSFDTSKVTSLAYMFAGCESLESLDLSNFNTSNVRFMDSMFTCCYALKSLNLSGFDTSKVDFGTDRYGNGDNPEVFTYCVSLRELTLGTKFSFKGTGNVCAVLPTPDSEYINGANGYWYTKDGTAYTPDKVPSNVAATYYAVNPKPKDINSLSISVPNKVYSGSAIKPVSIKDGNKTLKNGTDYTVKYSNNTKVGTATAVITGKGSYTGKVTKTFKITKANLSKAKVSIKTQTYTGKNLKPKATVKLGSKTLDPKNDYTITYNKKNNVKAGKVTVTIKGKGNYSGSVNASFNIAPAKVTGVKTSSTSKGKVTVKWSNSKGRAANATGYKVVVKSGSKTIKTQYVSGKSAKSKTISLASKYKGKKVKTYVYAYKTIGKTKVCSPASSASTVKVKK